MDDLPQGAVRVPRSAEVPDGSLRARLRSNPAVRPFYRLGMFVAGLVCVLTGFALVVLPGPLTIPPVLLGFWIWSKEFGWAQRLLRSSQRRAHRAREHARRRPVSTTFVTLAGLVAAGAALWAADHYEVVDRVRTAVLG